MKTEELIDHLKAGRPLSKNVVKQIIIELEWNATLRMENRAHQEQLGFYRERMESAEQRVKALEEALRVLSSGVEMLSGAPLASGKKVFYPNAISHQRMQVIARKALEATCQK